MIKEHLTYWQLSTSSLLKNFARLAVTLMIVAGYGVPVSAAVKALSFEADTPGTNLTQDHLSSHGVEFPSGVAVAYDPTTKGNIVIRPLLEGEFNREPLTINFSSEPHTVSLQVKEDPVGHSPTYGQAIVVTMTAYSTVTTTDISGTVKTFPIVVGSDSALFTSGDATSATLSTNHPEGIKWVRVEMTLDGIRNNLYLLADSLRVESDLPPPHLPADTKAPIISIIFDSLRVYSLTPSYRLVVTDDRRISSIHSIISYSITGESREAPICGTAETGGCPETSYDDVLGASLWDEGYYRQRIRACDAADNCVETWVEIELDLPAAPAIVRPWQLEVNQGVQSSWENIWFIFPGDSKLAGFSQPILPGKDTVVRWYLLADGAGRVGFSTEMEVDVEYSDGTVKSFLLSPNTGTSANVPEDPLAEPDRTQLFKGVMRPDLTKTLNFVIPGSDLMVTQIGRPPHIWPTATRLTIKLRGVTGRIYIELGSPTYLGLNIFKVSSDQTGPAPTDTQIDDVILPYMKIAMPVTDVSVFSRSRYRWDGDRSSMQNWCSAILHDIWWDFGGDDARVRYNGSGRFSTNMAVIGPSIDNCSGIANIGDPTDGDYRYGSAAVTQVFADVASHEVGHNIGLKHVGGSHKEKNFVFWPYPHGSVGPDDYGVIPVQAATAGQWNLSLIDPCLNASAVDLSDRYPCTVDIDGDGNPDDSQNTHELMSYGDGPDQIAWDTVNNGDVWPSNLTYNRIYSAILAGATSGTFASSTTSGLTDDSEVATAAPNNTAESERVDSLVIGGFVQEDGLIHLKPLLRKQLPAEMQRESGGRYMLRLFDAAEQILYEHSFNATPTGDENNWIRLVIPYVEGINHLVISDGGDVVAEISASPSAPTVQVLSPNGGEILSTGIHTVRWTGSDPDGDEVTYLVQYSPDGGESWQGLGHKRGIDEGVIEFDVKELIPGRRGLIRITATDGINIVTDDSDRAFSLGTGDAPLLTLANVTLQYSGAASAKDKGPVNGTFDAMLSPPGPVVHNGFTENRTAMEFDISEIAAGSIIDTATLTLHHTSTDSTRDIVLYGYAGDGSVNDSDDFADFTTGELLGSNYVGSSPIEFDVTEFIQAQMESGEGYAGFSLREGTPPAAPTARLNVIFILEGEFTQPVLDVTYFDTTPVAQLVALVDFVNNLKSENSNYLFYRLESALDVLEDSNEDNDISAINALHAFINRVEARRGKDTSDAEADSLIAAAQAIINSLSD